MEMDKYKSQREYYKKHKEEIKEYQRTYQREYQRKYRENNRKEFNAKCNRYYHEKIKKKPPPREKYRDRITVYF